MSFLELKKQELKNLLSKYKLQVDQIIKSEFSANESASNLEKACLYALDGAGKRFRPSITLIVAELLEKGLEVEYSALAIELFHTASLIADDLPSMDNDELRRDKPSLHKVFGEDVALLASYALIGEGYECVIKNKARLADKLEDLDRRFLIAVSLLSKNNSLQGAPSGQFLDLYPPKLNQESLELIFYRKTVLFFETAFALGWLFGGGDLSAMDTLNKASYHFGMAFQIYDDFCDLTQDSKKDKVVNYPLNLGKERGHEALKMHLKNCKTNLEKLGLYKEQFHELVQFLGLPVS